ncbi:MAG TPA: cyclopropane-fatty-acyl-phospholipid synthase family protein [Phenylobacterium sp.]|nr:cyclopropane-fatty-acyl-phospholipid synthase family protein [Phenylobacterium sp.]
MLTSYILRRGLGGLITTGALTVVLPDGQALAFGDGSGPPIRVRFTDARAVWAVILDPDLRTGEMFTEGRLVVDEGTIYDFLCLVLRHAHGADSGPLDAILDPLREALRALFARNDRRASRRNVERHYDLDDRLYALFLDPDWQYSCAYFEPPDLTLAQAQRAKQRHIAAKLLVGPQDRVLDIGCGWGGFACYLAATAGAAQVLGVTLSGQQIDGARARAEALGLAERVSFRLLDYRELTGSFDRIVSIGMFEHVGRANYDAFFRTCAQRLEPDGLMVLHTIGSTEAPALTNPWITRYIFPGGHLPSLSEIVASAERADLIVTDVEVWRLHYARTLRAWRDAFMARRAEAAAMFDERFCRMWEFYLALAEAAFRHDEIVVFQVQLTRRIETAPLARSYIATASAGLQAREAAGPD